MNNTYPAYKVEQGKLVVETFNSHDERREYIVAHYSEGWNTIDSVDVK